MRGNETKLGWLRALTITCSNQFPLRPPRTAAGWATNQFFFWSLHWPEAIPHASGLGVKFQIRICWLLSTHTSRDTTGSISSKLQWRTSAPRGFQPFATGRQGTLPATGPFGSWHRSHSTALIVRKTVPPTPCPRRHASHCSLFGPACSFETGSIVTEEADAPASLFFKFETRRQKALHKGVCRTFIAIARFATRRKGWSVNNRSTRLSWSMRSIFTRLTVACIKSRRVGSINVPSGYLLQTTQDQLISVKLSTYTHTHTHTLYTTQINKNWSWFACTRDLISFAKKISYR